MGVSSPKKKKEPKSLWRKSVVYLGLKKLCATPTFKNGGDFNARRYL